MKTGYMQTYDADKGKSEADILVCGHSSCGQRAMTMTEWKAHGGQCFVCGHTVCGPCMTRMMKFGCEVFEKVIEDALNDQYRKAQNAKILGT